jgi:hypothetical protein
MINNKNTTSTNVFINFFNRIQKESTLEEKSHQPDEQTIYEPKQPMSEGELYGDLLTMHMFSSYYPHVFPDQYMFK